METVVILHEFILYVHYLCFSLLLCLDSVFSFVHYLQHRLSKYLPG